MKFFPLGDFFFSGLKCDNPKLQGLVSTVSVIRHTSQYLLAMQRDVGSGVALKKGDTLSIDQFRPLLIDTTGNSTCLNLTPGGAEEVCNTQFFSIPSRYTASLSSDTN